MQKASASQHNDISTVARDEGRGSLFEVGVVCSILLKELSALACLQLSDYQLERVHPDNFHWGMEIGKKETFFESCLREIPARNRHCTDFKLGK